MKKKTLFIILAVLSALVICGFVGYNIYRYPGNARSHSDISSGGAEAENLKQSILSEDSYQILVAYFSYTGTTKQVAESIAEKTGADLFEIKPASTYSNVYIQSNREIRRNERPALAETLADTSDYDIVLVGFPVWWHATPAPVNTFLESSDLKNKLIIPFCTSSESPISEALPTFLDSCEGLTVLEGKRVLSGDVDAWLRELGILKNSSGDDPSSNVPEDIQTGSITVEALADLPVFDYSTREINVKIDTQNIYGVAYIPEGDAEKWPLVLCSHGLGGTYRSCAAYAEQLASHGIAAYCFDFRGGGGTRSDGKTTGMSVMTEVADLEAILDAAKGWDFVDVEKILLLGTSQGGIVSAITAARHTNEVAGLILCYPAFLVHDDVHRTFSSLDSVPETFSYQWITAGRIYVSDMWDYDVYAEIGNYTKPVLLMHGSSDSVVPLSYAERAAEVYPDVEYYVINGAGHGFNGRAFEEATEHIFEYLQKNGILER